MVDGRTGRPAAPVRRDGEQLYLQGSTGARDFLQGTPQGLPVCVTVAGRAGESRPPSAKERAATTVLARPLTEVSLKMRSGPPIDDPRTPRTSTTWLACCPCAQVHVSLFRLKAYELRFPTVSPGGR